MTDDTPNKLDTDTYHELLSNGRRRSIIRSLQQYGTLDKGELATLVAAEETGKAPDDVESEERKRVVVSLTQSHLDTLEEAGVIEREHNMVKRGKYFHELAKGLDSREEGQPITITLQNATVHIEGRIED